MFSEETRKQLEELHKLKILGIDLDILFMILISYYITITYDYNFYNVLITVVLISIITHRIFKINTRINEIIFGKII
jgi:hypothetical protein